MDNMTWVFNLLFIPSLIFMMSVIFYYKKPNNINFWYGYRTTSSMKNQDTWVTANKYASKLLLFLSSLLVVIILVFIFFVGKQGIINLFGSIKTFFFVMVLIPVTVEVVLPILLVERKMSKIFDKYGNRKDR